MFLILSLSVWSVVLSVAAAVTGIHVVQEAAMVVSAVVIALGTVALSALLRGPAVPTPRMARARAAHIFPA